MGRKTSEVTIGETLKTGDQYAGGGLPSLIQWLWAWAYPLKELLIACRTD